MAQKLLTKKERKSKTMDQMDRMQDGLKDPDRDHNDSFEKHYNKDLDLEEGNPLLVDLIKLFRPGASCDL